jgi:hypothetical protein
MKWVEIITIRSASGNINNQLIGDLVKHTELTHSNRGLVEIRTYRNASLETDFSIQLYWESKAGDQGKTPLGFIFYHALRDYGLLNHSVWIESEDNRWYNPCELSA